MTEIWEDVENIIGETFMVSVLTLLWIWLFDMILNNYSI